MKMIATTDDFNVCREIHKKHGKNYYFATQVFPKSMRQKTYALYAFFRIPDEIVDNPEIEDETAMRRALEIWRGKWRDAYASGQSDEPVLRANVDVFKTHEIPFEYSEAFFDAMIQDTWKRRYQTYGELEEYMYGSAAVVGLMMSYVIGFKDPVALKFAEQLGYAMQLTNFLRDVAEDVDDRGRIYLPLEDLHRFGATEEEIRTHTITPAFTELMQFEIQRTRALYEESDKGIPLLTDQGQFAVRLARGLYSEILTKIEEQNYNIYNGRASTSFGEKLRLAGTIWINQRRTRRLLLSEEA